MKIGVIRDIDPLLTTEEISDGIKCSFNECKIDRIERFKKSNLSDTIRAQPNNTAKQEFLPLVKIFFEEESMPEVIRVFGVKRRVFPYIPSVRRCDKCMHYGHLLDSCKGKPRCGKCSSNHMSNECDSDDILCCNCGGNHPATSKKCPEYKFYFEVNSIRVKQNLSFQDAKKCMSNRNGVSNFESTPLNSPLLPSQKNPVALSETRFFTSTPNSKVNQNPSQAGEVVKVGFSKIQVSLIQNMIKKEVETAVQATVKNTTQSFIQFLTNELKDDPNCSQMVNKIQASGVKFLESRNLSIDNE